MITLTCMLRHTAFRHHVAYRLPSSKASLHAQRYSWYIITDLIVCINYYADVYMPINIFIASLIINRFYCESLGLCSFVVNVVVVSDKLLLSWLVSSTWYAVVASVMVTCLSTFSDVLVPISARWQAILQSCSLSCILFVSLYFTFYIDDRC